MTETGTAAMTPTVISGQMMAEARNAATAYITEVTSLNEQLSALLTGLIGTDFAGKAAEGYNTFYTTKVLPAVTTNLVGEDASLMSGILKILTNIEEQIVNNVDPTLGQNNSNAGSTDASADAAAAQ